MKKKQKYFHFKNKIKMSAKYNNNLTTLDLSILWWDKLSSAGRTRMCDIHPEIVGKIIRWETLTGRDVEELYKAEHPPLPTTVDEDKEVDLMEGITQGEWKVNNIGESWKVKEWAAVANIQYGGGDSDYTILAPVNTETLLHMEAKSNARLIASAPRLASENKRLKEVNTVLLEALKKLYESVDSCIELTPNLMNKAKAAIEQANNSLTNKQS